MQRPEAPAADLVKLGRIVGVYGVRGWLKVHSDTIPRENIVGFSSWWISQQGEWRQVKIISGKRQGKNIVAQLDELTNRDEAKLLTGAEIAIERSQLPTLSSGEFYWLDLVGCEVISEGIILGRVKQMMETGANDVLVVRDERIDAIPGSEILVPWIRPDVVTEVNIAEKRIHVDWDPDF